MATKRWPRSATNLEGEAGDDALMMEVFGEPADLAAPGLKPGASLEPGTSFSAM